MSYLAILGEARKFLAMQIRNGDLLAIGKEWTMAGRNKQ